MNTIVKKQNILRTLYIVFFYVLSFSNILYNKFYINVYIYCNIKCIHFLE